MTEVPPTLTLNDALKTRLRDLGMTQQELAARCQISESYLSLLLAGKRVHRLDNLTLMTKELGCRLNIQLIIKANGDQAD